MKNSYTHVSCALHSELELMIMHGETLELSLAEDSGLQKLLIKPRDIVIRKDKGEYLLGVGENDKIYEIRLDHIIKYHKKTHSDEKS